MPLKRYNTIVALAATVAHSVELPERCKLPKNPGPCRAAMPRWAFNQESKQCEQFTFGGCLPNENNFFTETECENACEAYVPHQELQESQKPKQEITPRKGKKLDDSDCTATPFVKGRCRASLTKWSWNPDTLSCEKFVYSGCDGSANNYPSKKKCLKKCEYLASQRQMMMDAIETGPEEEEKPEPKEPEVDPCTQPKETGRCRARFDRFYYNSETNECSAFTYGGCEGNGNNFQTKQLCESKCVKKVNLKSGMKGGEEEEPPADRCSLPKAAGFCRGFFQSWYFDGEACTEFVYGGCQGNANRFPSKEECESACAPVFGRVLDIKPQAKTPVCQQPIETGPCRAMYPKFAFDGEKCKQFMYGGCMGNENNFASMQDCRSECMMPNDLGPQEEEEEEEEGAPTKQKMSDAEREAIREAKKRERQILRKRQQKKGKGKKNGGKVKGLSKKEEDEMRFNFNRNMLTF